MRRFYVKAYDEQGRQLMTSIQVVIPADLPLSVYNPAYSSNREADHEAVNFVVGRVAAEFARYAASECLLAHYMESDDGTLALGREVSTDKSK